MVLKCDIGSLENPAGPFNNGNTAGFSPVSGSAETHRHIPTTKPECPASQAFRLSLGELAVYSIQALQPVVPISRCHGQFGEGVHLDTRREFLSGNGRDMAGLHDKGQEPSMKQEVRFPAVGAWQEIQL